MFGLKVQLGGRSEVILLCPGLSYFLHLNLIGFCFLTQLGSEGSVVTEESALSRYNCWDCCFGEV